MSRAVPALAGSTTDGALTFSDGTSYVNRSPVVGLPSAAVTAEVWFRANAFANWSDLASHNWGGSRRLRLVDVRRREPGADLGLVAVGRRRS